MELSQEDRELLKKAALAAIALVIGGRVVRYVRKHGELRGYVYRFDKSKSAILGLLDKHGEIETEVAGELVMRDGQPVDFIPDDQAIPPATIEELAEAFDPANIDPE